MEEILSAREHAAQGCYKIAFECYLRAFYTYPRARKQYETEFRTVLTKLNEILSYVNDKDSIIDNFECALNLFPDNLFLNNDIGKYLCKYGYFTQAMQHFEQAMAVDSSYPCVEKNLNNAKNFLFPRRIFKVLNDKMRNNAFRRAIRKTVVPDKDLVLDLNSGTGLLSLYANECRPKGTTVCDSSKATARLVEKVMHENNIQEIVLLNKAPTALCDYDIYELHNLLITDGFDAGLFGAYILQVLSHAHENLLIKKGARVLPLRAELFVVGARSDRIGLKYQLSQKSKEILNLPPMNIHATSYGGEAYYEEDVHLYDDVKYVTNDTLLLEIDFNSYSDILEKLFRQVPYDARLTAVQDEQVNLVIGWFNLYLTEDIYLTTDPRNPHRTKAWQQAIFYDQIPRHIKTGDSFHAKFLSHYGILKMLPEQTVARLSAEVIAFLNDEQYMDAIQDSLHDITEHVSVFDEINGLDIVDLSPFPVFGFLMMLRGAKSLMYAGKNNQDIMFIDTVFRLNDIPSHKLDIITHENCCSSELVDNKYHIVFCDELEMSGDIDPRKRRFVNHLKSTHSEPDMLFLPQKVTMMCALVNSASMEESNQVNDENIGTYKFAKHIKRYELTQAMHIDLSLLEYTALSEPALAFENIQELRSDVMKIPILMDGEVNAIICWYNIQVFDYTELVTTKRSNSSVMGSVFFVNPAVKVFVDDLTTVLCCADADGSVKLTIDNLQ